MTLVRVNDLNFTYSDSLDAKYVLSGLNMVAHSGQITVIIGPSGCGKTTLLNVIAGLLTPLSGTVDHPEHLSDSKTRVGFVFQESSLIPWRSVWRNALFGAEIGRSINNATKARAKELLAAYGLEGFENEYPSRLSGGMQQRVSMIRAAVSGAAILLLDEPFSNSDYAVRRELQKDLADLVAAESMIAILVTHDLQEAIRLGDRIIVLSALPAHVEDEFEVPISHRDRMASRRTLAPELQPYLERLWSVLDRIETQTVDDRAGRSR